MIAQVGSQRQGWMSQEGCGKLCNNILDTYVHLRYDFFMVADSKPVLKTLQEAITYFADPDRAFEAAVRFRFPGGDIYCPRCGAQKFSFIKTRRLWFSYASKNQCTVK